MHTNIKGIGNLIGGQIINRVEAKRDDFEFGEIKILAPKAITNGVIDHSSLTSLKIKTMPDEKKLTKEGDIVLKLSQPYEAAYINKDDEGLLVTSFCIILRNIQKDEISPNFILTFINSELYKEQVLELTSGASVPLLTKGLIEKITLDVPTIIAQSIIVGKSDSIKRKEALFNEVIKLEKMKLENMLRGEE